MHILVTFDENYVGPFKTMVKSFMANHSDLKPTFWLLHSQMSLEVLEDLIHFCENQGALFEPVEVSKTYFKDAKVTSRYPESMYYRLLAPIVLPRHLNRVLYLDPDILIINSLNDLWEMDLPNDKAYAAASHSVLGKIRDNINNIRLDTDHPYFNSGVMLVDLDKARKIVDLDEMIKTVNQSNDLDLILPDQDLFNSLYGRYVHEIPDEIYNYDARYYPAYLINSNNEYDLNWVLSNTSILHFCGKKKPWHSKGVNVFTSLYKYFMFLE